MRRCSEARLTGRMHVIADGESCGRNESTIVADGVQSAGISRSENPVSRRRAVAHSVRGHVFRSAADPGRSDANYPSSIRCIVALAESGWGEKTQQERE